MIDQSLLAGATVAIEKEAGLVDAGKGIVNAVGKVPGLIKNMPLPHFLGGQGTGLGTKAKGLYDTAMAKAPEVARRTGEAFGAGAAKAKELGGKALEFADKNPTTTALGGGLAGAAGVGGVIAATRGGKDEPVVDGRPKPSAAPPIPNPGESRSGISGAMSQLNEYLSGMSPGARNALIGGGAGALAGGLYGLMSPGEETVYDEMGRPTGTRRKSRLMSALRNAAVVGGLGAGAGGLYGSYGGRA